MTKHMSVDIYTLNLFIEHSGEHWWEQNIFCSFTTPQAFWKSSVPGALSTLVTSVVLYSLTRATLTGPGKDATRVCGYIYIYYISHIYTHKSWNKTNAYKLLLVSCFHIHQAYTITLTRYTNYIITKKFKLLSHFLTPVSIVLINIAVNQYDATLNIIIWRFSRGIYFDGDI